MKTINPVGTRAASLTALLAHAPEATDHDGVRGYLHSLTEAGCAPLLVYPASKMPADMRTSRVRSADDAAAQAAAKDAGNRNWAKVKSAAGVHLATTDTAVLGGYLDEYTRIFADQHPDGVPVNAALSVGRSRLVVVDCDTADQLAAFLARAGAPTGTEPTVRSPGQANADGEMVHKDGGHYYFAVPDDVELPTNLGAITDPDGDYAVLWGAGRYVLMPPSVREEGAYAATGAVHEVPRWLLDYITTEGQARAERAALRQQHASASGDAVTAWGASVTWADILGGTGWTATGKADSCGCDTWTAPGLHASAKSATAHEPGCAVADSADPCLHVWTDHDIQPFDAVVAAHGAHLTRLRAVAAIHFNNDMGAAMSALDLHPTTSEFAFGDAADTGAAGQEGADQPAPSPPPVGASVTTDPVTQSVAEAKAQVVASLRAADALFDHTEILRHIAACANARGSSPIAALVQVLIRVGLAISPRVVIPAHLGGDYVGLSLLAAVTGESSGGKGRAEAVGRDAITLSSRGLVHRFAPVTPSTGEGLVSMFAESGKDEVGGGIVTRIHRPSALLSFKDIDTFGALASRSGNSLVGALLSLYMGDTLGAFTREATRRVIVPAHTVVAGLSAGVQPSRGSVLLSPAMRDSGIPQRVLWTPVRMGRKTERGGVLDPMAVELPDFGVTTDPMSMEVVFAPDQAVAVADLVQIEVAQQVANEIRAADEVKDLDVFGAVPEGYDQLQGHALLTRTKVAFLMSALHGGTGVTEEWWELAGLPMAVSEATVSAAAVVSGAAEIVAERQAGERVGHRFAASDQVRDTAKLSQVADKLAARVGADWGSVNATALFSGGKRDLIPDAWRLLIDSGVVEAREHEYQPGKTTWQYRRAQG